MIAIDALSVEEIRALDLGRQIEALSAILAEVRVIGEARKGAVNSLRDAKLQVLRAGDNGELVAAKSALIVAQANRDVLKMEYDYRREQAKILQTLIRAVPA